MDIVGLIDGQPDGTGAAGLADLVSAVVMVAG